MRSALTSARPGITILIAFAAAAAPCFGQAASPPVLDEPATVQEAPGEGDTGQSEDTDEAADAKPYDGP